MEKITKYNLYVGSNNITHKREFKKAINVLNNFEIKGFSIIKDVLGFWENEKEKSFIIEILGNKENPINDNKVKAIKKQLEINLKQYLVLITKENLNILS